MLPGLPQVRGPLSLEAQGNCEATAFGERHSRVGLRREVRTRRAVVKELWCAERTEEVVVVAGTDSEYVCEALYAGAWTKNWQEGGPAPYTSAGARHLWQGGLGCWKEAQYRKGWGMRVLGHQKQCTWQ